MKFEYKLTGISVIKPEVILLQFITQISKVIRLIFFLLVSSTVFAAQPVIDLKPEWKQYDPETGAYVAFERKEREVVYFLINVNQFNQYNLVIRSLNNCSVFINEELYFSGKAWRVAVDSLAKRMDTPLLTVAIVKKRAGVGLQTWLEMKQPVVENENPPRPNIFLRNFVIIGVLILVVLLVVLFRLNPKLASDYFSVTQIFSNRESNDTQVQTRIASSSNILFYVFSSLLIGFCLMVVFSFVTGFYSVALSFQSFNFLSALFNWLKVSALILIFFFIKIVLIYSLSRIFQLQNIAGMYFFNWIRVLLLATGAISVVLVIYFIRYGNNANFFKTLFEMLPWLLAGWMILITIKLQQKLHGSMFHLFSYICATELIPFLITIKVLFS